MAEAVILLAVTKIGIALGVEAISQATSQFRKFITPLTELQGSMGRIRRELRLMHGFLCQMDVRNRNNHTYEIWVEEVRMLVHGIEDAVDEYLHIVCQKHGTGWRTYLNKRFKRPGALFQLNMIASLIKEAEVNLVHLFQAKDRWVLMVSDRNTSDSNYIVERSQHLASISRSLGEEDLVGFDENREKLELWLSCNDLERSVIALRGMGGLGKTALAANVYRKERGKFDCHAWVSISQSYSREDVLKRLVTELHKERKNAPRNIANMDTEGLEDELKKFLEDKKYLIVLDDVWAAEAVNELLGALVQNLKGSRILVTTRIDDVAHLALQDRTITLESLSKELSTTLFCKTAFPGATNHECPIELTELTEQIISKCKGIPLAIVSVGRLLLVRDKTKEELKRIHDQLDWELVNNPSLEHVRNILYLSYVYLPTYLKSCFLYCSLFPEDHLLKRKSIIRLWMSEGFIEKRGESTIEEVAEVYLNELIHRNMLQLIERNSFGRIKSFRMHDIVRDLAVDLCKRECFGATYVDKYGLSLEKDERRLVVHKLNKNIHLLISGMHSLRSVIALDNSVLSTTLLPLIAEKSRYMSVLELSGLPFEKIPDAIGLLFNLRYLGLRGSKVKLLPESIQKLSNLLVLDLYKSGIQELPRGIVKLQKLRHLFAEKEKDRHRRDLRGQSGVCTPKGLWNLRNMQTLHGFEVQDEFIEHLRELTELKSFRVWGVKGIYCKRLSESLVQMEHLSHLDVNASDENEVILLSALPPNLQKLRLRGRLAQGTLGESHLFQTAGQHLYELGLYWSHLTEDPLPCLSRLANLTYLVFTRAYRGEELVFCTGWFPKLRTLRLRDMPNLKRLEIEEGAMASLERLTLVNLNGLTELPPGIEFLVSLKYLGFREITPDFLALLRQCPRIGARRWWYSLQD